MTITELSDRVKRSAFIAGFWAALSTLAPLSSSAAGRVTVVWDPSPGTNAVAEYKIYYGAATGTYTNVISAGTATTLVISNLIGGTTYYFAATAVDAFGLESDYSNEASALVPVNAGNQPPTLDPIVNLTINENASMQTVHLSGITSGATNENQTLSVTAASSNAGLIPTPAVSYTSPSTTGLLTFTPTFLGFGSSTITVTVNDGAPTNNTTSRAFTVTVNPVNLAPTLDPIADVTINEGAGLQTVGLSGIGPGAPNESQTLTITAASSNPALIPAPAVSYTSPNTTGSISFTPVALAYGTANITVTVNDGGTSNNIVSRTFAVTVRAVNQPPTLDPLADVNMLQTERRVVNLSGISSGATNEAQALTVTAASSDPSIVPVPAVTYVSPNVTGSIALAPVTNAVGEATVTVTVNDGAANNNTFSRSFKVIVAQASPRPADCSYSIVMNPTEFSPNAASGTFSISTAASCTWTLAAPSWITLSTTNGTGAGAGTFTVGPNVGSSRIGAVVLTGSSTNVSCTITQQALPVGAVALAAPLDEAILQDTLPNFSWVQAEPVAPKFYLLLNRDGSPYVQQWVEGTTNWTTPADLPGGSYTWAVQTWTNETAGLWSSNSTFTIQASAPSSTIRLVAPLGMAKVSGAVRFSWKRDAAATRYQLHIEKDGGVFFDQTFSLTDSLVDSSTGEFAVALSQVTSGTYLWWVRGVSAAGYGPWSDRGRVLAY